MTNRINRRRFLKESVITAAGTLADEANKLATRNYRKPFVVPENV